MALAGKSGSKETRWETGGVIEVRDDGWLDQDVWKKLHKDGKNNLFTILHLQWISHALPQIIFKISSNSENLKVNHLRP